MKLNPITKRLQESVTPEDIALWNEYCFDTNSDEYELYQADDLDDIMWDLADRRDPIGLFWEGVNSVNIRGAEYLTYAPGYLKGLSSREVKNLYLSDPDFLKWKREHAQSEEQK